MTLPDCSSSPLPDSQSAPKRAHESVWNRILSKIVGIVKNMWKDQRGKELGHLPEAGFPGRGGVGFEGRTSGPTALEETDARSISCLCYFLCSPLLPKR